MPLKKTTHSAIKSPLVMRSFGKKLAHMCQKSKQKNMIIFLQGDLGSGKTTLVRGFLEGLGYVGKVKSPTFTIVESYEIDGLSINHFDLYRLQNPIELENIGFRDYLTKGINLIEWPEKAQGTLPTPDLTCSIQFSQNNPKHRLIILRRI